MGNDELVKKIKEKLEQRESKLKLSQTNLPIHEFALWSSAVIAILMLILISILIRKPLDYHLPLTSLILIMSISVFLHSKLYLSPVPINKKEKDKWLWEKGKKLYYIKNLVYISGLFIIFVVFTSAYKQLRELNLTPYFQMFLIGAGLELASNGIILYISKKPKLLLDGLLTGFGSILKHIAFYFIYYAFLSILLKFQSHITLLISIFLTYWIITYYMHVITAHKRGDLDIIQGSVIQFVNPILFYNSLRNHFNLLKDKKKALKIITKLEKKEKYGVQQALLEELTKRHTKKSNWLLMFLTALFLFIIYSIGEGFFQDLIYEPLKKLIV